MRPPTGSDRNPKLRSLPGPSPLRHEIKAGDIPSSPEPSPPPEAKRNALDGSRPTPASETPSEASWLANRHHAPSPAPRRTDSAHLRQSGTQLSTPPVAGHGRRHTGPTLIEQIDLRKAERAPVAPDPLHGGPTLMEQIDQRQGKSANVPVTRRNDGPAYQRSAPQRIDERPIERHATLLPPAHMRQIPDLDTAIKAMRQADTELAGCKADLAKGQRQLRTAQYALNSYRRNPPELIEAGNLGRMEADAAGKGLHVGTLQARVDNATVNAENRRRDVRASLSADS